jgi:predicted DsbA family dithiol-disulfide isomerase
MNKPTIKIDVVSDVVCPWCYIGKRRLEKAMKALADKVDFDITYHPFELNPQLPETGYDQVAYLTEKFGSSDRYEQLTNQVSQVAASEGLSFQYDKQTTIPNTRRAHALMLLAQQEGKQLALVESLFKAYFTDGVDLTSLENLLQIAEQSGIDKQKAIAVLSNDESLKIIESSEKELQKLGITGVPFYIVNNKYGISGAQASETFIKAFTEMSEEMTSTASSEGVCDVDSKDC